MSNRILYFRRLFVFIYDICLALKESHCSFYCKSVTTKSGSFVACFQTTQLMQYKKKSERKPVYLIETLIKIDVYGKRLTSRISFEIKSKSRTVKCSSHTIY